MSVMEETWRLFVRFSRILFFCQICSCASSQYKISTDSPATVTILDQKRLQPLGKPQKTPHMLDAEATTGKVIKVEAKGKIPQYWVFSAPKGDELHAQLKLSDLPPSNEGEVEKTRDANVSHRLLMKSYQAFATGDLEKAKTIATELKTVAPKIAAPSVILGLISLRQGDKNAARLLFEQAKALDPQDSDIEKLLNAVR
jgi:hypothetical protein